MTIKYETAKKAIEIFERDRESGLRWDTAVWEASQIVKGINPYRGSKNTSATPDDSDYNPSGIQM